MDALDSLGDPLATFDTANTNHIKKGGNPDGYLAFNPNAGALNYSGKNNLAYSANSAWSGSITFWLQTDIASFESNYPEPFHVGKKNDENIRGMMQLHSSISKKPMARSDLDVIPIKNRKLAIMKSLNT